MNHHTKKHLTVVFVCMRPIQNHLYSILEVEGSWKTVLLNWTVGAWIKRFYTKRILVCCIGIILWYFGEECSCFIPVAKVEFGLAGLARRSQKQPSIDSVLCLLMLTLMKTYNKKEKIEKGKLQNVKFEEEESQEM